MKPWILASIVVLAWIAWTRKLAAQPPAAERTGERVFMWQTYRAQPAGTAETESRSAGTESEMRATKAAVEANGGTFRYYALTP